MLESLSKNESFNYKKLSPKEMTDRKILGRLVGPCADIINPTRNGRKYGQALWEKVFSDDIVLEKINCKCLFGEFGHPADREEVDPDKIALALSEVPKKNHEGQLIACFDILDTPSGRILKTVCDYGANIGISSRGSGDIIEDYNGEEVVDPETYYFECFDAVLLPAVKQARLQYVTESVDTNTLRMKKALKEELEKATKESKEIMKETLKNLNINIEEDAEIIDKDELQDEVALKQPLQEASKEDKKEDEEVVEEPIEIEDEIVENEPVEDEIIEDEIIEDEVSEDNEVEAPIEDIEETPEEIIEDEIEDEIIEDEVIEDSEIDNQEGKIETVQDFVTEFSSLNQELPIVFKDLILEDKIYTIDLELDETEDQVELGVICTLINKENSEDIEETAADEEIIEEEPTIEVEDETEEAKDFGEEDKILENLKEVIRQKSLYESEIKSLKNDVAVSDAKAQQLEKDVQRYKESFIRVSKAVAKKSGFEKQAEKLSEELAQKNLEIKALNESVASAKATNLTEIETLKEEIKALKVTNNQLNESLNLANSRLEESKQTIKTAKNKTAAILNKYIESKATMLGVNPIEITNRLTESYTLSDIDTICENLLSYNVKMNNLPFRVKRVASPLKITEAKQQAKQPTVNTKNGIDADFESLLEMAGLKY